MLQVLNNIDMDGVIVIGEGEKDEVHSGSEHPLACHAVPC